MDLDAYLARIGLSSRPAPDLEGLTALHRAQGFAIPYEGIDVFLGRPVRQDLPAIFAKLVTRRRGGWCYEMNGLLGWALKSAGFQVRRATGAVYRKDRGETAHGNHVVLVVTLPEGEFVADLGLGDFLRDPLPLRDGDHVQDGMTFRVAREPDGWWRILNDAAGTPANFDLFDGPPDEDRITARHDALQADATSAFRQTFQAIRMRPGGADMVFGRVLYRRDGAVESKHMIQNPAELAFILTSIFGLQVEHLGEAWPLILQRHAVVFGAPDTPP